MKRRPLVGRPSEGQSRALEADSTAHGLSPDVFDVGGCSVAGEVPFGLTAVHLGTVHRADSLILE